MRYNKSYNEMQKCEFEQIYKNFFNSKYVKFLKFFNLETQEY